MPIGRPRAVQDQPPISGWAGTAARVPDGVALQVHLLAVAKGVAALGAPRTGRVEVVVAARLQDLAADVSIAVGTLDTVRLLVALLAVRHPVLAHILAVQHGRAVFTPASQVTHQSSNQSGQALRLRTK